ncbi:MAG: prolyl oligopeptidase family serine peptidase [Duncaniella sp.]|uniref:prolyl oligopeptidase family serine peptidase n=1 Tax=Duncaniella sp. TaxID=2518496 RepID=UPI0023D78F55|nr:prolyl oligopeptidase family serine peptidase [Duncaniella sp.]MDE6091178.1 prolyl oligopeptidase family serine peptidase [Duncaniella sp.]
MTTLALGTLGSCSQQKQLSYPAAPSDGTVDTIFGMTVPDIYRPLENDTAAETLAWVEAENAVTEAYLSQIPFRSKINSRLTDLTNYLKRGLSYRDNDGMFYFYENDGLKNQSVLYRKPSLDSEEREVFLDPNALSDDGTVALTGVSQSKDGKYTAYTISRSGSDWTEIYVMDTKTKELLPDHIEWAKFTGAAWDGDGFYYSAYPAPEEGKEFSNANQNHLVYYHKIGTPQSEDTVVFSDPANPFHFHHAQVAESQPVVFVTVGGQGVGNALKVRKNGAWVTMSPTQDYSVDVIDVIDNKVYILTSYGAPKKRLMVADLANPSIENWKELVPEAEGVLTSAQFAGDKLFLTYEKDAANQVAIYDMNGNKESDMKLPGYGSVGLYTERKYPDDVYYTFTSFTSPSAQYAYDTKTGESRLLFQTEVKDVNFDDYVTEQVFYPSADGTKIPMFLTYKKGLKRDGKNPVYLYGYGGFNISLTPSFSAYRMFLLENGVIYAQANLRGGSEYGEEWHEAGTKMNKLNVFNDFIAAAEYLIKENWTSPDYITIEGGSNGGLLVGATVNLRPDLFKVAIPRVGVMDMMRYHLFTIGWNWASDYGTSADSPEMAKYLFEYSPIHNISNDGTPYPAILVTTADHDDRVVPAHSFKYAATLQAADTGDAPKLIRIDSKAGHGAGKPVAKVIDEYTDMYSFMFENLGIEPK